MRLQRRTAVSQIADPGTTRATEVSGACQMLPPLLRPLSPPGLPWSISGAPRPKGHLNLIRTFSRVFLMMAPRNRSSRLEAVVATSPKGQLEGLYEENGNLDRSRRCAAEPGLWHGRSRAWRQTCSDFVVGPISELDHRVAVASEPEKRPGASISPERRGWRPEDSGWYNLGRPGLSIDGCAMQNLGAPPLHFLRWATECPRAVPLEVKPGLSRAIVLGRPIHHTGSQKTGGEHVRRLH